MAEQEYPHMQTRYQLRAWFFTAPGSCFLSRELEQMARVLPNLFGFYLLQIGLLGDSDLVAASRVLNRQVLDVDGQAGAGGGVSVQGSAGALPVASDSVDVVVLPHLLEFDANPHEALREVERVLVPEGHVVVSGFNPWSLMGLWRMAGRRRRGAPWNGHFLSLTRIKDWLALLGFDIVDSETFFFRVPFRNERIVDRSRFLESLGKRFWPYLGGGLHHRGQETGGDIDPHQVGVATGAQAGHGAMGRAYDQGATWALRALRSTRTERAAATPGQVAGALCCVTGDGKRHCPARKRTPPTIAWN